MKVLAKVLRQAVDWLRWALAPIGLFYSSALAHAQGCAMCYTSAAASKAGALHALRSGILILLVPVLAMCAGIFVVIYRSRNRFCGADWAPEQDRELRALLHGIEEIERPGEKPLPSIAHSPLSVANRLQATDH